MKYERVYKHVLILNVCGQLNQNNLEKQLKKGEFSNS